MTDARATTLEDLEASARVPRAQQLEVQVEPRLLDHPSARAVPPGDGGHDGDGDGGRQFGGRHRQRSRPARDGPRSRRAR